ncbi:hypothetical protein FRC03_012401 [Tulasnella sp. 419]|nr:hypothetical protein FRC03_012401 [Tulasnella sp. 419]
MCFKIWLQGYHSCRRRYYSKYQTHTASFAIHCNGTSNPADFMDKIQSANMINEDTVVEEDNTDDQSIRRAKMNEKQKKQEFIKLLAERWAIFPCDNPEDLPCKDFADEFWVVTCYTAEPCMICKLKNVEYCRNIWKNALFINEENRMGKFESRDTSVVDRAITQELLQLAKVNTPDNRKTSNPESSVLYRLCAAALNITPRSLSARAQRWVSNIDESRRWLDIVLGDTEEGGVVNAGEQSQQESL